MKNFIKEYGLVLNKQSQQYEKSVKLPNSTIDEKILRKSKDKKAMIFEHNILMLSGEKLYSYKLEESNLDKKETTCNFEYDYNNLMTKSDIEIKLNGEVISHKVQKWDHHSDLTMKKHHYSSEKDVDPNKSAPKQGSLEYYKDGSLKAATEKASFREINDLCQNITIERRLHLSEEEANEDRPDLQISKKNTDFISGISFTSD
ncbi:MAG: hypothetical protein N4A43_04210 [Alphaproteobacteria bacterium]|jgi:hypothetical protein|nr:hypothetical protein [Alphaproteobacteria bacterium]